MPQSLEFCWQRFISLFGQAQSIQRKAWRSPSSCLLFADLEDSAMDPRPDRRGNRWNLFVTTCANPKKFMFPTEWGIGRFERIGIIYPHLCAPFVGVVETVCGQRGGSTISTKCMFSAESSNFDPVLCRHVVSDPRLLSREERGKPEARTLPRRAFYTDAAAHAPDQLPADGQPQFFTEVLLILDVCAGADPLDDLASHIAQRKSAPEVPEIRAVARAPKAIDHLVVATCSERVGPELDTVLQVVWVFKIK
jgi:hypothetical protein